MALFTLKRYNDMIDSVNQNLAAIPKSCGGPGDTLDHHDKDAPLTKTDFQDIRDAIDAICSYNWTVDLSLALWEKLLDEIYLALSHLEDCCHPCADGDTWITFFAPPHVSDCPGPGCGSDPPLEPEAYDLLNNLQVASSGWWGRTWEIYKVLNGVQTFTGLSGAVGCNGKIPPRSNMEVYVCYGLDLLLV